MVEGRRHCQYKQALSDGTIFLRLKDESLWSITQVNGREASRRGSRGQIESIETLYLQEVRGGRSVVLNVADLNRWTGIAEIIYPEDGEVYEDLYLHYRFPWVYPQE